MGFELCCCVRLPLCLKTLLLISGAQVSNNSRFREQFCLEYRQGCLKEFFRAYLLTLWPLRMNRRLAVSLRVCFVLFLRLADASAYFDGHFMAENDGRFCGWVSRSFGVETHARYLSSTLWPKSTVFVTIWKHLFDDAYKEKPSCLTFWR